MSEMEYNKGKLIPTGIDTELFDDEAFDQYMENGYEVIDSEIYEVIWETRRGELYDFCNVKENDDGSIEFETYHYNGGGHWTELVENKLK